MTTRHGPYNSGVIRADEDTESDVVAQFITGECDNQVQELSDRERGGRILYG